MTQFDGDGRVCLRRPDPDDQDEFIALAQASAGLHHPWYSMPVTPEGFGAYLAKLSQPATEGFLVCLRDGGARAGVVTIDSIIRGSARRGMRPPCCSSTAPGGTMNGGPSPAR
jgi:ribosomal-protein-alanine N-acetyltransferase